jgi:quercetin dioxygenase-like cupin family protein
MFRKADDEGYRQVLDGVRLKTLVHGERTMLCEFRFVKGAVVPEHKHPHEQTGCVVSGSLKFVVNGEISIATPGDSWNLPAGIPHGAEALEESVVIEVFAPPREDYLPWREGRPPSHVRVERRAPIRDHPAKRRMNRVGRKISSRGASGLSDGWFPR